MKKFVQKKLKDQKGMTLIELLAVIVIIAIIAAIAIPAIGNIIENSRFGAAKSDFQNAFSAVNLYKADEGKLPTTLEQLDEYMDSKGTLTSLSITAATDPVQMGGKFKVSDVEYTLPSTTTNASLSAMSTSEFKDVLTPKP